MFSSWRYCIKWLFTFWLFIRFDQLGTFKLFSSFVWHCQIGKSSDWTCHVWEKNCHYVRLKAKYNTTWPNFMFVYVKFPGKNYDYFDLVPFEREWVMLKFSLQINHVSRTVRQFLVSFSVLSIFQCWHSNPFKSSRTQDNQQHITSLWFKDGQRQFLVRCLETTHLPLASRKLVI